MVEIVKLECKRCGHSWIPRIPKPAVCPKCHSPYWDKEKRKGVEYVKKD